MSEKKKEEISFEHAMDSLEEITNKLESGEITLDESMELFSKGMELTKLCSKKIEQIEKKISKIVKDEEGNIQEKEF